MVSRSRRLRYYAIESGQSQAFSAQILKVFCTFGFVAPIRWFIFTILVFAAGFSAVFRRCFRFFLKFSPKNFVCFFSAQAFCAPFSAREAIRIGRRLLSALWAAPAAFLSACRPVPKKSGTAACPLPGGAVPDFSRVLLLSDASYAMRRCCNAKRLCLPVQSAAARSWRVYSCWGWSKISSTVPCSTMRPCFITSTRSHSWYTTFRSWLMNR